MGDDMAVMVSDRPLEGVVRITLNRPDRLNTLTAEMVAELSAELTRLAGDRTCRVVVLTGAGRGFCAGLDLRGYTGADEEPRARIDPIAGLDRQRDIARLAVQLHQLPQPVISAINGPAAGGGLACASDIRLAATGAVFAVGFIRAGFSACDIGLSWLLPRIVGTGRAHELMLTGRRWDTAEALRIGLVTDAVDPEDLMDVALEKAGEILLNPPFSVELTKQGMWASVENPSFTNAVEFENRQQILSSMTADRAEAAQAFLEKRTPTYGWR
ncbi:enoyl-CoA hydratase/isomerase family protein [Pseudonocardia xishanensis]|uniref:Enoyl-CoA hydratase/isomerase family protein n=1 Tax=Pseudonocardia xishanensis TaxID=630995 RepID=A0ABP8RNQ8_9PSEU